MNSLDMSQFLSVFLDEGREQLGLLEANILSLERGDHLQEILQALFRAAHTLKGSSRAMGFLAIGDLTHEMENVLDDLRNDRLAVTTPIVDALLDCRDTLTVLIDRVAETSADTGADGEDIPALVGRLHTLRAGGGDEGAGSAPGSVSAPTTPTALSIPLHVAAAIAAVRASEMNVHQVSVTLQPDCRMKSLRVFMVLGALEPLGTVLFSDPGEEALDEERFDRTFQLLHAGGITAAEIEQALGAISELESVRVSVWGAEGKAAPPSPALELVADAAPEKPQAAIMPAAEIGKKPAASERGAAGQSQTIRVDVARLDNLLNLIGELVIDRIQIARLGKELHEQHPQDERVGQLLETTHRVARVAGELQEEIMKARMLPIDGVFQRMPRMIRDLAQKTGKEVHFEMSGGETELDRSVLERLSDPLIHLLRNSVDHGIETPEGRSDAGKPKPGRVTLTARHEENHIVIEITDDGRGIDPARLRATAVKKGILTQAAADALGDRDAINLIFTPGFSTAAVLSDISGRGVGMDIVEANVEKLGGRLFVDTKIGQGSRFTIRLPLTLAIVRALLINAGGGSYVLPLTSVVEILRLGDGEEEIARRSVGGQAAMLLRGRTVPLANLADVLGGNPGATHLERIASNAYVVVVRWAEKQVGLCVDALIGEQDVVIKSLGTPLGDIAGFSEATILGDGRVARIIDIARAVESIQDAAEVAAR